MKTRSGNCLPFLLIALAALVGSTGRAGVYDSCAAWWHFDYDGNTNGLANTDDIRDQRDWGTAMTKGANGRHADLSYGPLGTPAWTNATVSPAGGSSYGGMSMVFNPVTNLSNQCWPDTFKLTNFVLTGSATLVTRFRWDGYAFNSASPGWLYNNGLYWTTAVGWMFGVQNGRLSVLSRQTSHFMNAATLTTNKWYEAAAVITDNGSNDSIEFYLWAENDTLRYEKVSTTQVTNAAYLGTATIIGAEASSSGYASGNTLKAFKGAVNHLAVWNRALSFAEVAEAFGYPHARFQIGLNNDTNSEFRAESESGSDFDAGAPWHTLRRAVTPTDREVTIRIPLNAIQASLGYVFHVNTLTPSGQGAGLSLIVNRTTNEAQAATQNADLQWHVTSDQLVTGTNAFTLKYENGAADAIRFDWLELGGSWQVGTNNNSATEFMVESSAPDDFYITDPNLQHLERAIVQGTDTNTVLHFVLSPELAARHFFTYSTRVVQQGRNTGTLPAPPYPFSIGVNGRILEQSAGVPDNTLISIPFARGDLQAGENTVNLIFNSTNGWLQFDFHRLEIAPWPAGTLLYMR